MTNAGVKTLITTFLYVMVFPMGTGTLFPRVILACFGMYSRPLNYIKFLGIYLFLAYVEQLKLFLLLCITVLF